MSPRAKSTVLLAAKVAVAATLITWLVRGGALDFGKLRVLVEHPWLFAMNLGVFAIGVVANGLRWRVLLGAAGVVLPLRRTFQLQMTALFFNVVIPGNVGGDVVKALYVARDADKEKRTTILLIVFAERLLGLGGLVTIATVITVLRGPVLWSDPLLRPMAATVALLGVATVVGPAVMVYAMRRGGARVEAWLSGSSRLAKLLAQLAAALRLLSSKPKSLLAGLALSMGFHATGIALFTVLTQVITHQDVTYSAVATVFPLGLLTIVLPISPAGLGVGHVAFDRLFAAIGLSGGATVFNVYIIGQMAPCLLGVFPYLTLKRSGALPAPENVGHS